MHTRSQSTARSFRFPRTTTLRSALCRAMGFQPNCCNTSAAFIFSPLYRTSPIPIKGNDKWLSGDKSPLAPKEPWVYTTGSTSLLYMSIKRFTVSICTPLLP